MSLYICVTMFIFSLFMQLKEKDLNRFANRGGGLLKEEKIRKTLMKELPKVCFFRVIEQLVKW